MLAARKGCASLPMRGNRATREHFVSELLFLRLALEDICHSSSVTYKQSLALHPGATFPSLQIAQVTDKLYDSDAKPSVSGVSLVKKQREEGLWLLRSPAHCWERSEGFWSILLHLCALLSKLHWKKVPSPSL